MRATKKRSPLAVNDEGGEALRQATAPVAKSDPVSYGEDGANRSDTADRAPDPDPAGAPGSAGAGELRLGLAGQGALRWVAADVTGILREVAERLDLSPVAAAALGRAVSGAAMLLRLATKTPSRLVLDIRGDGPLRQVLVEVDQEGHIRGTVGNPRVEVPDLANAKLAVGRAIGSGHLRVLREFGEGGSYHSHVELVSGEIGEDLAHYLRQSEQSQTAVLVGVLGRKTGVAAAGGLVVEILPGAHEETVAQLEANLAGMGAGMRGVSWLLEEGGVQRVLETVLAGLEPEQLEARELRYRCRCSRQRLQQHLVLLSAEDRDYLSEEDGAIEADCVFCGNHYRLSAEELAPEERLAS